MSDLLNKASILKIRNFQSEQGHSIDWKKVPKKAGVVRDINSQENF